MPTCFVRWLAVLVLASLSFPSALRAQVAIGTSRVTVRIGVPGGGTVDAAIAQSVSASIAQANSQLAGAGVRSGIETLSVTYGPDYVQYVQYFLEVTQEVHNNTVAQLSAGGGFFSVVASSWTQTGTSSGPTGGGTGTTPGGNTGTTPGGNTGNTTGGNTGNPTGGNPGSTTGGPAGGSSTQPVLSGNSEKAAALDQTARSGSKVGGPVDTGTGAESFSKRLFLLSGARPLEFTLSYSSAAWQVGGDFGAGWYHPYSAWITKSTTDSSVVVSWSTAQSNRFYANPDDSYSSADPAARYDRLVRSGLADYVLTRADQSVYVFTNGSLTSMRDRHGRGLNITKSALGGQLSTITEPVSGARLTFTYGVGGITRVADQSGRAYTFVYESINGSATRYLTSITDPAGRTTRYAYTLGQLSRVTAPDGTVTYSNTYDSYRRVIAQDDGRTDNRTLQFSYDEASTPGLVITTVTDRAGARRIYSHDIYLQLVSVRDETGGLTSFQYESAGLLSRVTDPLRRSTSYAYDLVGNLAKVTDPEGRETAYTYDARHNCTAIRQPDGRTATFTFDARNNLTLEVGFDGARTSYEYDANSLLTKVTSPLGAVTTHTYTAGRRTATRDPLGNTTTFAYDAAGRLIRVTDPTGATRQFSYSATDLIVSATDPLGNTETSVYDARDRLTRVTDANGGVTSFTYDGNGNVLTRTDPLGGVTTYTYDGEDRRLTTTDARGNRKEFQYDAAGRLTAQIDEEGGRMRFEYDAVGNRTGIFDALGHKVTTITYSASNLPLSVEDALGRARAFSYDALQRVQKTTDPLARNETFAFDGAGRPLVVTDAGGLRTSFTYDLEGNVTRLANAADAAAQFTYNANGRRTSQLSPTGRRTTWSYDSRDLLATQVNAAGNTTTLTYNAAVQLIRQSDAAGAVNYTYDRKGRPTATAEGARTLARTYDANDRITRFTDSDGNSLNYAYDANGNLTQLTYPDGKRVTYTYDKANRMTRIVDWANRTTTYAYDANHRIVSSIRANGTRLELLYDAANQLVESVTRDPRGTVILDQRYTYDAAGRLAAEVVTPAPVLPAISSVAITYDADDRVRTFGGASVTYDAAGNLSAGPLGDATTATFQYDARGRLTAVGDLLFRYDAENRRIATDLGSTRTTYVHNPLGRPYTQLLQERTDAQVTLYVWGPEGMLYRDIGGQLLHYHHDFRGSTLAVTNADGTVTGRWSYGPYGEVQRTSGSENITHLYGGQYGVMREANGLYYMRARHYSPVVRRFLTPDPAGYRGGQNWYAYAGGVPNYQIDPDGKWFHVLVGAAVGAAVNVAGQFAGDMLKNKSLQEMKGNEYLGALVGGAAGGAATALTGNTTAGIAVAGAIGGFIGNLVKQGAGTEPFSGGELAVETVVGGVVGPLAAEIAPAARIPAGSRTWQKKTAEQITEYVKTGTEITASGVIAGPKDIFIDKVKESGK